MAKRRKIRVDFQKNREKIQRPKDLTRQMQVGGEAAIDSESSGERVRGRGEISRRRTIVVDDESQALALPNEECLRGRVLVAKGLQCTVASTDGLAHHCYVRRLLKSLASDSRSPVAVGDWVWFKPAPGNEGMIVRVEPRSSVLKRCYRQKEQVIAANVDQALIVAAVIHPDLKTHLIDRYIVSAGRGELRPIICINKIDYVDSHRLQPVVGMYSQLGYRVALTSATTGLGIDWLKKELQGRQTVIVGQSGVGKSSLLNALEPRFLLKVGDVSEVSGKGKHTTTSAQLLELSEGGAVVDTAGVRQFELWDVPTDELEAYFVEIAALAGECRFPGCRHVNEDYCAVRTAVADGYIHYCRYESYLKMLHGE